MDSNQICRDYLEWLDKNINNISNFKSKYEAPGNNYSPFVLKTELHNGDHFKNRFLDPYILNILL